MVLFRKGSYGAQSDKPKSFSRRGFEYTQLCVKKYLGNEVELLEANLWEDWMGEFRIKYKYLPKNYLLEIEHSRGFIDMLIRREDDGGIGLSEIYKKILPPPWETPESIRSFKGWGLRLESIESMSKYLAYALKEADPYFYICKDGKRYRDDHGTIKRIRG